MFGVPDKDYYYAARCYKQKALEKQIEDDIKVMAYTLLKKDKRRVIIEKATDVTMADGEKLKGFDAYPSCKHWEKKFCPAKNKRVAGYIEEWDEEEQRWTRPYRLLADSVLGIYLEVINFYLGKKTVFPAIL